MLNFQDAYDKLALYNQTHLLKYYDELPENSRKSLLSQIENLDFSVLKWYGRNTEEHARGRSEPINAVTAAEIALRRDEFMEAGISAIKRGKVGAVLLAGGQGTRLGSDNPKGMFNIGITKDLYIFECIINNMLDVVNLTHTWFHLFIMTSEINDSVTKDFFEEHDYFGYNPRYISFFVQDMAPAVDMDGLVLLEAKDRISASPNGNGGWFSSMVRAGLLEFVQKSDIEWLNVFSVDNVLQRIADPLFVGATIACGYQSGGKVVRKANPEERVGVLCLEDGVPSIVEYYEMSKEMCNMRDSNGELLYNFGVTLNYLFRTDRLVEIVERELPVHVVVKKIQYMDENGNTVNPDKLNGYKFETLVLDMIHMQDSCLPFEVDRRMEFAPVKNATGVDSVETARELLIENGIEL